MATQQQDTHAGISDVTAFPSALADEYFMRGLVPHWTGGTCCKKKKESWCENFRQLAEGLQLDEADRYPFRRSCSLLLSLLQTFHLKVWPSSLIDGIRQQASWQLKQKLITYFLLNYCDVLQPTDQKSWGTGFWCSCELNVVICKATLKLHTLSGYILQYGWIFLRKSHQRRKKMFFVLQSFSSLEIFQLGPYFLTNFMIYIF